MTGTPPTTTTTAHSPARWVTTLPIAVPIALTLLAYALFAATIGSETSGSLAKDAYYNRLVDGFKAGHLYLDKQPPAALLALKNPYDPKANGAARGVAYSPTSIHDLTFYKGRLYLYFSAVPAVLLFLPYHLLTGGYVSHQWACAIFAGLAFLSGTALLVAVWRRYFRTVGPVTIGLGVLALGLAPLVPAVLQRPDVYEVPIMCGYLFTMLALGCLWRIAEGEPSVTWAAALSVCVGLAIGSRPSDLLVGGLLAYALAIAWRRPNQRPRPPALRLAAVVAATLVPALLIGAALLAYNYARFGNPAEFGMRYQLNGDDHSIAEFGFRYLPGDLWMNFIRFAGWTPHFPFAGAGHSDTPKHDTIGLLTAIPVIICAVALFAGWKRQPLRLRRLVAGVAWIAAANALLMSFFFATSARYEMSFAPELVLLGVLGILAIEAWGHTAGPMALRRVARICWLVALVFSVSYNVLIAVRRRGMAYALQGTMALLVRHNEAEAIPLFHRALEFDPDDAATLNTMGGILTKYPQHAAEAIAYYHQALRVDPDFPQAHSNLGLILSRDPAHRDEAIAECRAALRLKPDFAEPRRTLAYLLAHDPKRLAEEAARDERSLAQTTSRSEQVELLHNLATVDFDLDHTDDVVRDYEAIVRLSPGDAQAENNLGAFLARMPGRRAEAIVHLRAAVRLAPGFAEAHNNLAFLLSEDPASRAEAIEEYKHAIALNPDYDAARRNLSRLLAGSSGAATR